jgi:hypothetical protein
VHHTVYLSMALQPYLGPWPPFYFLNLYTVGLLGRGISPSQGRYLHTEQHKHRSKADMHPCLELGFEPMIPVFERANTVHASDSAATLIGNSTVSNVVGNFGGPCCSCLYFYSEDEGFPESW